MPTLSKDTALSICKALRSGTVPDSGLEHYAVGLDKQMAEIAKGLDRVAKGKSDFKFIRGDYGSGKTFLCSLAAAEAMERGFVVSKVVISNADTPLYRLEEVYKKICSGLTLNGTPGCFSRILETWLYNLEAQVIELDGISEDSPDFSVAVGKKVDQFLKQVGEKAGRFASAVKAYHRLLMEEDYQNARGILDWLGGDAHVSAQVKRLAGLKGDIGRSDVFAFLGALLEIIRQSQHKGLFLVLDEVETVLRQRSPERKKGLEILRQLVDAAGKNEFPGLYLMVTGTPDFFESSKGVPAEPPLHERIRVDFKGNEPDNLRQPQLRLSPFDDDRLLLVAHKVREIYPADHPRRVTERVDQEFTDQLVQHFTNAFGGKISVTPRLFLRELIHQMDLVDQHETHHPKERFPFDSNTFDDVTLTPEERESLREVVL